LPRRIENECIDPLHWQPAKGNLENVNELLAQIEAESNYAAAKKEEQELHEMSLSPEEAAELLRFVNGLITKKLLKYQAKTG